MPRKPKASSIGKEPLVLDMERINNVMAEGSFVTIRQDISHGILEINCTKGSVHDGTLEKVLGLYMAYNREYAQEFPGETLKQSPDRDKDVQ